MQRVLRFKHHLRVEPLDGERVFLLGERERFMLHGRVHAKLAPLIDGSRTVGELIALLEGEVSAPEVYYALMLLEQNGYVAEASSAQPAEVAAFWDSLGFEPGRVAERLAATPVSVRALGGLDPQPMVEALAGVGVNIRDDAELRVVLVADYLAAGLADANREAIDERRRWMLVKPTGVSPWIGPMFRPGRGPCWACLASRLRANRPVETFLQRELQRDAPPAAPRASLRASARAGIEVAVLALTRWIAAGGEGSIDDKLIELDCAALRILEHTVVRRPQCPSCGDPELSKNRGRTPVQLESRPKGYTDDGGYRCITPEEAFARSQHNISPITGVVASLGPAAGRDHPLRPVQAAVYFTRPAEPRPSFQDFSKASMGKGRTAAQARMGALSEAIERYSALFQEGDPLVRARLSELDGVAVPPPALLHFSEKQYQEREASRALTSDPRRLVPRPFDERVSIDWAPAWSLSRGELRYLPAAYCYASLPVPPEERFCYLDPNGHAAGSCAEETILQALFELGERDAAGIWWYNRLRRPAVDLASFEQPYFTELEEHYAAMGHRIWVLDVTNDLGLPAFVALARAGESERFCVGFGCHAEARLGVQRALTELNQLFDPSGSAPSPWGDAAMPDIDYLLPAKVAPRRRDDYPDRRRGDIREEVLACVEQFDRAGLEVIVLDQTRPDVGLSAFKVIAPGSRHFWPRLGPGRLYDVPVRMGWLARPRAEEELNPVPLFL